jgi:DNA mismatch repair protein MutH
MEKDSKIKAERERLLKKAKEANGKTVGEIDTTHFLENPKNKGRIGQVIQIYLGKNPDNDPSADFPEADLELKVTGLIGNSKKDEASYRAKERLVLHEINYVKDAGVSFEDSGLLKKCDTMLISCYRYLPSDQAGVAPDYSRFPIIDSFIYHLTESDIQVIKDDYDTILSKINSGHAETISESDTHYLAACTKSSDSSVRVNQFHSDIKAKPRAFSLKPSFLTAIIHEYISKLEFASIDEKAAPDIETHILNKLSEFYNWSDEDLARRFPDVNETAKSKYALYILRILGTSDLSKTEVFQKANIHIKTIRVEENGSIEQNMSFGTMDFCDVAETDYFSSDWFSYFEGAKFLFVVFQKDKSGHYFFQRALFYRVPDIVTEGFIRYTYNRTQEVLRNGDIVSSISVQRKADGTLGPRYNTNFVGIKENPVCHVRPHAANFLVGQKQLPVPDKLTGLTSYEAACFWLDRRYIASILSGTDQQYLKDTEKKMNREGHPIYFDL